MQFLPDSKTISALELMKFALLSTVWSVFFSAIVRDRELSDFRIAIEICVFNGVWRLLVDLNGHKCKALATISTVSLLVLYVYDNGGKQNYYIEGDLCPFSI